jgi:hypothetical protein
LENAVPVLTENKMLIEMAIAKPTGLNDLGAPLLENTIVKKGKLREFSQSLEDGRIGRRFQNLRVTAIRTMQGAIESAKIFIQFEVFGDDNVPEAANSGFAARLYAGPECLLELTPDTMFLPYARFWYDNSFVFDVSADVYDRIDHFEFIARPDQVRII